MEMTNTVLLLLLLLVQQQLVPATCSVDALYKEICAGRPADEFFRLATGTENCQDVFSCSDPDGDHLNALRCPKGHHFDVSRQLCEWADFVSNCDLLLRRRQSSSLPLHNPECQSQFACGDGTCLELDRFCDGKADCADSSDENSCDIGSDPGGAPECGEEKCAQPECFCSKTGTLPPGNMSSGAVPQMITLVFAGPITQEDFQLYENIFQSEKEIKNPNGCNLHATFFVSHENTNYSLVNELHRQGHEIGSNTISRNQHVVYWNNASHSLWLNESLGQGKIISRFAKIPEVRGFLSPRPNLLGGNRQFAALQEGGFSYDASIVVPRHSIPLYPYTLHSKIPHPCHGGNCPTKSFPKLWAIPTNELVSRHREEVSCSVLHDDCETEDVHELLTYNFLRHYHTNRAPLMVRIDASWLRRNPSRVEAVKQWIHDLLEFDSENVFFVTASDVLEWMRSPTPSESVNFFRPWYRGSCRWLHKISKSNCKNLHCVFKGAAEVLDTCAEQCPQSFPWVDDVEGIHRL